MLAEEAISKRNFSERQRPKRKSERSRNSAWGRGRSSRFSFVSQVRNRIKAKGTER